MNNKEILILAITFIGTLLFRLIAYKDFEGGYLLGILNMMICGAVMWKITENRQIVQSNPNQPHTK